MGKFPSLIWTVCTAVPTDEIWIGLNDQKTQNLFEWADRSHVTFTKWLVGEPSHTAFLKEDCVLMKGKVQYIGGPLRVLLY